MEARLDDENLQYVTEVIESLKYCGLVTEASAHNLIAYFEGAKITDAIMIQSNEAEFTAGQEVEAVDLARSRGGGRKGPLRTNMESLQEPGKWFFVPKTPDVKEMALRTRVSVIAKDLGFRASVRIAKRDGIDGFVISRVAQ